jgi:hypothetical protein
MIGTSNIFKKSINEHRIDLSLGNLTFILGTHSAAYKRLTQQLERSTMLFPEAVFGKPSRWTPSSPHNKYTKWRQPTD